MSVERASWLNATSAPTSFPGCGCGLPRGLFGAQNLGKLFFSFYEKEILEPCDGAAPENFN